MKTAVELIFDELHDKGLWSSKMEKIFEQAKEMEKEQIIEACDYGKKYHEKFDYTSEQYYNETFKSE